MRNPGCTVPPAILIPVPSCPRTAWFTASLERSKAIWLLVTGAKAEANSPMSLSSRLPYSVCESTDRIFFGITSLLVTRNQQGPVRLFGEFVYVGQTAVHHRIEVIALWNAPFHAAEPSDVPVEVRLALTLLEEPLHELGGGAVRLAGIGVMLDLVLPDRVVVLLLRLGRQQDAVLVAEDVDVVALGQGRVHQPEDSHRRFVPVRPGRERDVQGLPLSHSVLLLSVPDGFVGSLHQEIDQLVHVADAHVVRDVTAADASLTQRHAVCQQTEAVLLRVAEQSPTSGHARAGGEGGVLQQVDRDVVVLLAELAAELKRVVASVERAF